MRKCNHSRHDLLYAFACILWKCLTFVYKHFLSFNSLYHTTVLLMSEINLEKQGKCYLPENTPQPETPPCFACYQHELKAVRFARYQCERQQVAHRFDYLQDKHSSLEMSRWITESLKTF